MSRRRAAAVLLALLGALALAPPASAEDISRAELEPLLRSAAEGDPAAQARLDAVTSIDGRPADLERALSSDPDFKAARAAELERALESAGSEGSDLSQRAGELAGEGQPPPPPPPAEDGGSSFSGIGISTPVAIGLALAVLLIAAVLAQRAGSRRLPPTPEEGSDRGSGEAGEAGDSAGSLERQADRAARDGDHATAVRLLFRAGLQRLAGAQAIELRPSLTAGQVARALPSGRLRGLVSTFERVAYGNVSATEEDSSTARREWPLAVREASGR